MEVNEKILKMLEDKYERLERVVTDPNADAEERKNAEREILEVTKQMQELYKTEMDYFVNKDKLDEHSRIEKERNEASLELEKQKQKLSWQRVAFELSKVIIPIVGSGILYFKASRDMYQFEENGRITSTPGRQMRLPNIFK